MRLRLRQTYANSKAFKTRDVRWSCWWEKAKRAGDQNGVDKKYQIDDKIALSSCGQKMVYYFKM